jgi:hypothetical protein
MPVSILGPPRSALARIVPSLGMDSLPFLERAGTLDLLRWRPDSWGGRVFAGLSIDPFFNGYEYREEAVHLLILPYWLLILLFAAGPVMRWRRNYVERRDKKFFEQAVAAKRAEQAAKEKRNDVSG